MSINRLIARIAAVCALDNYLHSPWPTSAGPNIFDSKIEPVEEMKSGQPFPCVVVYTDYDKDHWNKGAASNKARWMTVTLEMLIVQASKRSASSPFKLSCPVTDSEIETALDILEVECLRALTHGTEASDAFNYICPSPATTISRRGASADGGQRLAARQVTLEMKAIRDNAAGVIPPVIAAFLTKLEEHDDYAARVSELREVMTAPASGTSFERTMWTLGYTRDLMVRLGGAQDEQSVLPPVLTFHLQGASP